MNYGRTVFGLSAVVGGVVGLLSPDVDSWQHLHFWTPLAIAMAWSLPIASIAGGVAMPFPRTARVASIVLGVTYGIVSLTCVAGAIIKPTDALQYINLGEQFSIVCGALAVYASTAMNALRSTVLARIARLGFGLCTISFAWAQVVYLQYTASLVPAWIPPNGTFWTILTTIAFALAAIAMLINYQARLALRLTALMLALFGLLVWVPKIVVQPTNLSNWSEIAVNYLITAAAWLVSEVSR